MNRMYQVLLIASFIPLCWLGFMAVHELGHVVAGVMTGGSVSKVVLHPLAISRTDVVPNPQPLVTVWAGPVIGVLLPLVIWGTFEGFHIPCGYLTRFVAGFCLIANGAYIAIGSFENIGDAGEMLRHGSPQWLLWAFGLVTVPLGFRLWHRLGPKFGLGEANGKVDERVACVSLLLCVGLVVATSVLSARS